MIYHDMNPAVQVMLSSFNYITLHTFIIMVKPLRLSPILGKSLFLLFACMFLQQSLWANCSVTISSPNSRCGPGLISMTAFGSKNGALPYTYQWSNGESTPTISFNLTETVTYTVTLTDANGCTATASKTVEYLPPVAPLTLTTNAQPPYCAGQVIEVTANHGGTGPFTYNWSVNHSSSTGGPSINVTLPASVSLFVRDANNCSAFVSQSFNVDNFFVTITTDSTDFVMCQGESINLKASVNNQIFTIESYTWSTGETGQQIFINSGGNYAVTATATNGCTRSTSRTIAPTLPLPEPVASTSVEYLCPSKTAKLNVAGSSLVKFKWSGGLDTVRTPSITQAGTYTVTVTGANTCTNTSSVTVKQGTTPPISVVGPTRLCFSAPQTLTLSVTGADNLIRYSWNSKAETPTIDVNTIGTYRVTVTNSEECTATGSITVSTEPPILASITGVPSICVGDTVKLRVAQTFDDYAWSNSTTGRETIVTEPGTYSVTVSNALGCTGIAAYNVGQKTVNFSLKNADPICPGDTAQLRVTGSTLNTYRWSTGQTTANINTTKPGTYTVTVVDNTGCGAIGRATVASRFVDTARIRALPYACDGNIRLQIRPDSLSQFVWSTGDSLPQITVAKDGRYSFALRSKDGCQTVDTLNVKVPALPKVSIDREGTICANTGGNALLKATPGFKKYTWSNGDSIATTLVTQMGNYSVQATDALGCTVVSNINIGMAPLPDLALSQSAYNCDGQLTLNANTDYANYLWSTGDPTTSISVNASGTYALTATNSDGCTQTAEISVQIPQQDQVAISGKTSFCPGGSTDLVATSGFVAYQWSGASQTPTLVVDKAGNYSVTATDANGCSSVAEIAVSQLPKPNVVVRGAATVCTGKTSTFTLQGNWSTWVWSTGETTQAINVGTAGEYTITATNNAGCSGTTTIKLIVSDTLSPVPNQLPYKCDGAITLDAGSNYANYKWSNGATTKSITVNQSGSYSVKVADFSGCSGSGAISVEVPVVLDLGIQAPIGFCQGEQAILTASPGFVNYLWSDNETAPERNISTGGTYSLVATDANGCSKTNKVTVSEWATPIVDISAPSLICIGSEALITASSPNATAYSWSNGNSTGSIVINKGGPYSVTVKDINGCTGLETVILKESEVDAPVIAAKNLCNGIVKLSVSGIYAQYDWSSGSTNNEIAINQAGTYSITVRNADGCTASVEAATTIPPSPSADISVNNISVCDASPADLIAPTGMAAYTWSNGANTSSIKVTQNGSYSLTVTDADGCTNSGSVSVQLTDNQLPVIQCPGDIVRCNMDSRVSYDLPVAQDNCISVELTQTEGLPSGTTYPVGSTVNTWIAKDAQGNTAICSFKVDILPMAIVLLESLGNDIGNTKQGFINLNVSGANPPYTFTWTLDNEPFAAETEDLANIGQGSYKVVVRDANDCVVGIETYVVSNTSSAGNIVNNNSLSLLPNPVSELLYVQFEQPPSTEYALILFDAKGRLVAENYGLTAQTTPLDMSRMPAGIYMLRYQAEGQTWTFRVVKQ